MTALDPLAQHLPDVRMSQVSAAPNRKTGVSDAAIDRAPERQQIRERLLDPAKESRRIRENAHVLAAIQEQPSAAEDPGVSRAGVGVDQRRHGVVRQHVGRRRLVAQLDEAAVGAQPVGQVLAPRRRQQLLKGIEVFERPLAAGVGLLVLPARRQVEPDPGRQPRRAATAPPRTSRCSAAAPIGRPAETRGCAPAVRG